MTRKARSNPTEVGPRSRGFTLLEVLVGLVIAVVVLGGVMGTISIALQYSARIKERNAIQPVLEAAAQQILSFPEKLQQGGVVLETIPEAPPVEVSALPVVAGNGDELPNQSAQLYRVVLRCRSQVLEFSVLAPKSELQ
jgi:prepilin-type N-terminal cleavage/methylation domain-containing protein